MKKILSLLVALFCILSMLTACGEKENLSAPSDGPNTSGSVSTYEGFVDQLKADSQYRSWGYSGYDAEVFYSYEIESYETDTYFYYSVVCDTENIDWLVRYIPDSAEDTLQVFCDGKWIDCITMFTVEEQFRKGNHDRLLAILTVGGDPTDNTMDVFGTTYNSKRVAVEDGVYVDYLCNETKWSSAVITTRGGEMAVFDGFVFADSPTEGSRIFAAMGAESDEALVCHIMASGSMEPALMIDQLYCFKKDASVDVGDVVLAREQTHGFYFAHRVARITADGGYILRGDVTGMDDTYVFQPQDILGVLVSD